MEDVVPVSEVCVIIHNLLVRMRQSGALDNEINEEEYQFDVVCQFLVYYTAQLRGRRHEILKETATAGNAGVLEEGMRQAADLATLMTRMRET